jgi:hypothetical protein
VTDLTELDLGTPGASARRQQERRRVGQASWKIGAEGEEALGAHLAKTCANVLVLHDRRIPGRRTNIDHLAVAPSGVFVIDAKRYKGKIEVRKPLFGDPALFIAGRNRTKLVEGLARQQEAVRSALAATVPEMPVHACLCFLNPRGQLGGSGLPLLRTLRIDDFPLLYPRKLSKRLNAPGALSETSRREVAELLLAAFPEA